jgi:hypothetical protein
MYTMPSSLAGDYSKVIGPFAELNGIGSDALRTGVARRALGTSIVVSELMHWSMVYTFIFLG